MQFVSIDQSCSLTGLRDIVGTGNLESILTVNSLKRVPNIGGQVYNRQQAAIRSQKEVRADFKINSLNRASQDSDVFENMALMGEGGWRIYQATDALPGTLKVPDGVVLADSENIIGNSTRINNTVYRKVIDGISKPPHMIDPEIFNTYSTKKSSKIVTTTALDYTNLFEFFKIPWGNMGIYSSISKEYKDFPVYPEEISDNAKANYTTMPDLIYQYEPWQLYTSSGPRTNTYTFIFHRDMWTGDHRDGKANELVRFCMAQCYPEYNGSAVNSATTTLYMNGQVLISGVLTDVNVTWDGPLGLDGYYLVCKLSLSMIEVSPYPLDYWTVKSKPLIG